MSTPYTGSPDAWGPSGSESDAGLRAAGTRTASEDTGTRARMREMKDQVIDQAKNSLRQAKDQAGSSLGESRRSAAEQIGGMAGAIRRTSEHLRAENQNRMAGLTESLAGEVDQVASYLRDTDARGMVRDLEDLARRYPAAAAGTAFALGLLGARFFRSSRQGGTHGRD